MAPLVVFRIFYGLLMSGAALRFLLKGWVHEQYIEPSFHFKYYGFEWVHVLPPWGMYAAFVSMAVLGLFIALGLRYRLSMVLYFLIFTYVEFIDVTYYLNHYYFMSMLAGLMIFVPAHRSFSLDVKWGVVKPYQTTPVFYRRVLQVLLALVYVYAGIAKLNPDWLLEAMPLRLWLPPHSDWPIIGPLFEYAETAYFFAWAGAFYDLTIPLFLSLKRTRAIAYASVVFFHGITAALFPIGMFPWIMMVATTLFFATSFHQAIYDKLKNLFNYSETSGEGPNTPKGLYYGWVVFMVWQIVWPFRYIAYPGEMFWTEQGYRFGWRVMLMEKVGYVQYRIESDGPNGTITTEVDPQDFLLPVQFKQMSTQPDLILQFAHYLGDWAVENGLGNPRVYADAHATLQGRPLQQFIDPQVDLLKQKDTFAAKFWILPHEK